MLLRQRNNLFNRELLRAQRAGGRPGWDESGCTLAGRRRGADSDLRGILGKGVLGVNVTPQGNVELSTGGDKNFKLFDAACTSK